jgi:AraC-like DNA-binding protein
MIGRERLRNWSEQERLTVDGWSLAAGEETPIRIVLTVMDNGELPNSCMTPDIFCIHRPAPPLDRFVEQLWYWEGVPASQSKDRIMPNGSASLIINLAEDEIRDYTGTNDEQLQRYPGAVLVGAYSRYSVIDTREQRAVLGVNFKPGGMTPFFAPAADELHNAHASLNDLWGSRGATLRERVLQLPTPQARLQLVEGELLRHALRPLERRAEVDFLITQLSQRQDQSIADLSRRAGLSARRITRLFALETGLTPKLYARIKRFERALQILAVADVPWIDLVQDCGYFDQSHWIRDCREISGLTPSELRARRAGNSNHFAL